MDSARPEAAARTPFRLATLGPPSLKDRLGEVPVGLGAGKPLALLCFLSVRGEARRDEALALLWGDIEEDRARNAFRQTLHRLRLALGDDVVVGDRQVLKLAPGPHLRTDISAFEQAFAAERFDEALDEYRGDFLEGFDIGTQAFEEWVDGERLRLRSRARLAAERAAQRALGDGRTSDAERALRKLNALAPSDAKAVEVVATGFVSLGQRDEAAEVLGAFAQRAAAESTPVPRALELMLNRLTPTRSPAVVATQRSKEAPFVGRAPDLARLLSLWRAVGEEAGVTVIVEGPRGIGKSRLVREFAGSLRALGGVHVLHGVEMPRGFSAPYAAIATALRPLVRAPGIGGASPHLLAEAARLLPELRDAFQLPPVEPVQEETARLRVCEGVAALLEAAAFERPVCLIVEDVHRSSDSTLELLGYLAGRLRRARVATVLAFDSDLAPRDTAARLRALAGDGADTREAPHLVLGPMSPPDVSSIVAATLGTGASAERIRSIVETAGGNPQRAIALALQKPFVALLERQFPNWRYLVGAALATVAIAIAVTAIAPRQAATTIRTRDTLLVATPGDLQRGQARFVVVQDGRIVTSEARARDGVTPSWADSIALPWVNALPSPDGRFVALERVTPDGSSVYVISSNRRDTVPLVTGAVEAFGMGWSPDGAMFLASRASRHDASRGAALLAFPIARTHAPRVIDSLPGHAVTEAAWSPDGTHIAWVARVPGADEEVFIAAADGGNARNVSASAARDSHLAWAADGSLLAFTSRRDGNAELYAFDLVGDRLWRLTHNDAQDDRAAFDRDGRYVAFESTRGGTASVYLMPSLGGDAVRVGDSTTAFQILGWRRPAPRYLDRFEPGAAAVARAGDTAHVRVWGLDQRGDPFQILAARWTAVDSNLLREIPPAAGALASERRFVALRDGLARVFVSVGAWRSDTAYVRIGTAPVAVLRDDFRDDLSGRWDVFGNPPPRVGAIHGLPALVVNADREWESGALSTAGIPVVHGLSVDAVMIAPFDARSAATTASMALVSPDPRMDAVAPRVAPQASVSWSAGSGRFAYRVGRDEFEEPVPAGATATERALRITVNANGTVTFLVDGVARWTSTVRVLRNDRVGTARLWLGGQDTGARVGFRRVAVTLGPLAHGVSSP